MFGQAIGPVFGGIICQYLGYHAIFWVLFIGASIALLTIILLLPETLRSIAGNGSTRLKGIHRPLFYRFSSSPPALVLPPPPRPILRPATILTSPVSLLREPDVAATVLFGAAVYALWSIVTSTTTPLFQPRFHLSDLQTGLLFLPNGLASILASILTGRRSRTHLAAVAARNPETPTTSPAFPFARARLAPLTHLVPTLLAATLLYGFSFSLPPMIHQSRIAPLALAIPLLLQFAISYAANAIFALSSTLLVDLFPGSAAAATAVANLARCLLGAGAVALAPRVIEGLGPERTFAIGAGAVGVLTPLVVWQWREGQRWARERMERMERGGGGK
jgi:hypothetical protein